MGPWTQAAERGKWCTTASRTTARTSRHFRARRRAVGTRTLPSRCRGWRSLDPDRRPLRPPVRFGEGRGRCCAGECRVVETPVSWRRLEGRVTMVNVQAPPRRCSDLRRSVRSRAERRRSCGTSADLCLSGDMVLGLTTGVCPLPVKQLGLEPWQLCRIALSGSKVIEVTGTNRLRSHCRTIPVITEIGMRCGRDGGAVAIELPGEVVSFLQFIGVNWPNVNEDKVRELASHMCGTSPGAWTTPINRDDQAAGRVLPGGLLRGAAGEAGATVEQPYE